MSDFLHSFAPSSKTFVYIFEFKTSLVGIADLNHCGSFAVSLQPGIVKQHYTLSPDLCPVRERGVLGGDKICCVPSQNTPRAVLSDLFSNALRSFIFPVTCIATGCAQLFSIVTSCELFSVLSLESTTTNSTTFTC